MTPPSSCGGRRRRFVIRFVSFPSRRLSLLPPFTKAISPASLRCFHYRWEQAGTVCWRKITARPSSIITLRDRRCDAGAHRRVTLLENQPNRPNVTQRESSRRRRRLVFAATEVEVIVAAPHDAEGRSCSRRKSAHLWRSRGRRRVAGAGVERRNLLS